MSFRYVRKGGVARDSVTLRPPGAAVQLPAGSVERYEKEMAAFAAKNDAPALQPAVHKRKSGGATKTSTNSKSSSWF